MNDLSPIQQKILALHTIRPLAGLSYREIGRQIASSEDAAIHPQSVKYHIEKLIKRELLTDADRPASVSPQKLAHTLDKPMLIRIPLMGSVNAGPATMLADERPEAHIQLSSQLLRSKNYRDLIALRVSGQSMNLAEIHGARIEHDDYIVIDRSKRTPRNKEIVVINNDNRVNVKRIVFDYEHGQVSLISESTEHFDPIFLSAEDNVDAFIEGTVIQVVKVS